MDIIVFPEACDVPCLTSGKEDFDASVEKFGERLFNVASETAKRCNAIVFATAPKKEKTVFATPRMPLTDRASLWGDTASSISPPVK